MMYAAINAEIWIAVIMTLTVGVLSLLSYLQSRKNAAALHGLQEIVNQRLPEEVVLQVQSPPSESPDTDKLVDALRVVIEEAQEHAKNVLVQSQDHAKDVIATAAAEAKVVVHEAVVKAKELL